MDISTFNADLKKIAHLEELIKNAKSDEEAEDYYKEATELYDKLGELLDVDNANARSGGFQWRTEFANSTLELETTTPKILTHGIKDTSLFVLILRDFENRRRRPLFHKLRRHSDAVVIIEGDSWTQHPFIDDLVDQFLKRDIPALGLGTATHLLEQLIEPQEYRPVLKAIDEYRANYLILSCGGNDTIGDQFVQSMLREANPYEPFAERFLDRVKATKHLEKMKQHYTELLNAYLDNVHEDLKIIIHGYAYGAPIPWNYPEKTTRLNNPFVEKEWLTRGLNEVKVHHTLERWMVTKRAIDMFNCMLLELARDFGERVIYVDLRDTLMSVRIDEILGGLDGNQPIKEDDDELKISYERLARGYWSDELHPNDTGFSKIAEKLLKNMDTQ